MRHTMFVSALPFVLVAFASCSGTVKSGGPTGDAGTDSASLTDANTTDGATTCNVASDCGTNAGAKCARTCNDGSNPCDYACSSIHTCVERGCAEDNVPSGCSPQCTGDNICVSKVVNGGAVFQVEDGGTCPAGRHPDDDQCVADPSYDCEPRPAMCGVPFDCSCTTSICSGGYFCQDTTPNEIDCALDAP